MSKARSGGGPNSRVVGSYLDRKTEPVVHVVSPGAVSRLGGMVGPGTPHKHIYSSTATTPVGPTNNTENLGPGGCGRQVLRSGSQSVTPKVAPPSKSKPFF
jgi:hypothetical protein